MRNEQPVQRSNDQSNLAPAPNADPRSLNSGNIRAAPPATLQRIRLPDEKGMMKMKDLFVWVEMEIGENGPTKRTRALVDTGAALSVVRHS